MTGSYTKLLDELVTATCQTRPDQIAIEQGRVQITYHELNNTACRLAGYIHSLGIGREDKVIILLPRCYEVYQVMLGVLKSGAAYILLDPEIPGRSPHDLCYIIYTSGTSGNPKGVLLEHRNVVNYVTAAKQVYPIVPDDHVLQGFSVSFDASVEEIWLPLSVIAHRFESYFSFVRSDIAVNGYDDIPSLRILIFGGEICPTKLARRWCREGRTVMNTYGSAEATVIATYAQLDGQHEVTIGKPLPRYEVWLVDIRHLLLSLYPNCANRKCSVLCR